MTDIYSVYFGENIKLAPVRMVLTDANVEFKRYLSRISAGELVIVYDLYTTADIVSFLSLKYPGFKVLSVTRGFNR